MGKIENISNFRDINDAAYTDESEGAPMMDIEKYIERLDLDRRESEQRIREDRREQDARWEKQREEDLKKRLEQDARWERQREEDRKERREKDARWERQREEDREEAKEREERANESFKKLSSDMNATKWAIIALCVSTLLSVAAMVVAVFLK